MPEDNEAMTFPTENGERHKPRILDFRVGYRPIAEVQSRWAKNERRPPGEYPIEGPPNTAAFSGGCPCPTLKKDIGHGTI
jgi:hypothetical protein